MAEIRKIPAYRADAIDRFRHFRWRIDGLSLTHHYVRTIDFNGLVFGLAERTLLADAKRLEAKIRRLETARDIEVKKLNAEMSLEGTGLDGKWHPDGPWSRYDNGGSRDGRLTRIGEEICFRLFDLGRSTMAVAHLCRITLAAAKKRHSMWERLGGTKRPRVELEKIPRPKLQRRYRD